MRRLTVIVLTLVTALLAAALVNAQDETFALTVLHTNDNHAHHEADGDGNGGVARQATVQNQIAEEVENLILLDGGDRFTGTLFHTVYEGQDQVQIMNALGYDAMALGNHEFDNGDEVLAEFVRGVNFAVLAANIDFSASEVLSDIGIEAFTTLDVNGESVGVIGMTTPDTPELSNPGRDLVFESDLVAVANAAAAELTEQGVNKIILLTHTGINTDLAIIDQLENIDLWVGGHSHTLYSNQNTGAAGEYPLAFESPLGEPILYVQAGEHNTYLGRIDIEFDAAGIATAWQGDTIFLSRYITPDPELEGIVADLAEEIIALRDEQTGAVTDVYLNGDRTICRVEECNLGNLIADGMRNNAGTDVAIMNSGGIRADIDEGPITFGEALTVQPFGNLQATFEISGEGLLAAIENGVSSITLNDAGQVARGGASGRFPQVSGMRFSFDPNLEPGSRVVSLEIEQEDGSFAPVDPAATYSVVVPNFVRAGGDGYDMFTTPEVEATAYDFGTIDYQVTLDYMIELGTVTNDSIEPGGDDARITIVNAEVEPRS